MNEKEKTRYDWFNTLNNYDLDLTFLVPKTSFIENFGWIGIRNSG